jgi:hypothetical protein
VKACSLDGCPRQHYAAGYCNPHWRRWRRNGTPGPVEIKTPATGPRSCSFAGCDRRASCKTLCPSHYAQQRRGQALAPIAYRAPTTDRDEQDRKRCSTCGTWQETGEFNTRTRTPDGLAGSCRRCVRRRLVAKRYGVTLEDYERLESDQGEACAICGGCNDSGRSLGVDHCHTTGRVRGLLCSNCNMAVGLFKEDPVRLRAAILYLALHHA